MRISRSTAVRRSQGAGHHPSETFARNLEQRGSTSDQVHPIAAQHPHDPNYLALQQTRNQMAHHIAAFPTLYKPLMKMIQRGEGLHNTAASAHSSWSRVRSHNNQFMKSQHLKFYQSSLDAAGQAQFARLESYQSAAMDVDRCAQALKTAETPQERRTRYRV